MNKAMLDRSRIMKTKYEHTMISSRKPLVDTDKIEKRAMYDRYKLKFGEDYEKT